MKLENVAIVSKVGNKDSESAARDVAVKLLATKATVYTISPVNVEGAKQMETLEEIKNVKLETIRIVTKRIGWQAKFFVRNSPVNGAGLIGW